MTTINPNDRYVARLDQTLAHVLANKPGTAVRVPTEFDVDDFLDQVERTIDQKSQPTLTELRAAVMQAADELAAHRKAHALEGRGQQFSADVDMTYDPMHPQVRYDTLVDRLRKAAAEG